MAQIRVLLDYRDTCLHYELYIHVLYRESCVLIPVPHGTVTTKAVETTIVMFL